MKYNISPRMVQFANGKYAIRKFSFNPLCFGFRYRDLKDNYWWSIDDLFIKDCVTSDLDKIKNAFDMMNLKVKEVL